MLYFAKAADVNAENNGSATPPHIAVYNTHKDVSERLIAKRADMNTAAKNGTTPLQNSERRRKQGNR
jgi:ankyrin repeat protein